MSSRKQQQYMRERLRGKAKPRRAGSRTQTTERIKNSCWWRSPHTMLGCTSLWSQGIVFLWNVSTGEAGEVTASDAAAMGRGGEALGANRRCWVSQRAPWPCSSVTKDAAQTRLQGSGTRRLALGHLPRRQPRHALGHLQGPGWRGNHPWGATCRGLAGTRARVGPRLAVACGGGNRRMPCGVGCDAHPRTAAWRFGRSSRWARAQQAVIPTVQRGQAGRVAATGGCCRGRAVQPWMAPVWASGSWQVTWPSARFRRRCGGWPHARFRRHIVSGG